MPLLRSNGSGTHLYGDEASSLNEPHGSPPVHRLQSHLICLTMIVQVLSRETRAETPFVLYGTIGKYLLGGHRRAPPYLI